MTLFRQLLAFALFILLSLFVGLWLAQLASTRAFLTAQLSSHAQDTATSLGLSITTTAGQLDGPTVQSMTDAIFDRGYYAKIEIRDLDGTARLVRESHQEPAQVPAWFTALVALEPPKAEAQIMAGWKRLGTIRVVSHPGYAYLTLWDQARTSALLFALAALFVIIVGGLGLKALLRPLHRVEEQAQALCSRQYQVQQHLPRTRELRRVVLAMNQLTGKIQELFDQQSRQAESYRQRAFQDSLTGMGNRRYLETQLNTLLAGEEPAAKGGLLLIHLRGLAALNLAEGYQAGDALVLAGADALRQVLADRADTVVGRLAGADFAVFLGNTDADGVATLAKAITRELREVLAGRAVAGASCGGAWFSGEATLGELLALADTALRQSQAQGGAQTVILSLRDELNYGRQAWLNLLTEAIQARSLLLYGQDAVGLPREQPLFHTEILARLELDQQPVPAGRFIPLAEECGLTPALDRLIVEQVTHLFATRQQRPAINLSASSLEDPTFYAWLTGVDNFLARSGLSWDFEFSESGVLGHLERVNAFTRQMQDQGHRIGIDHFGRSLSHFGYLSTLLPDYVKLDQAFTADLSAEAVFFVNALVNAAHSLDILVLAEGIETALQLERMHELRLDAAQGYHIGRPRRLVPLAQGEIVS